MKKGKKVYSFQPTFRVLHVEVLQGDGKAYEPVRCLKIINIQYLADRMIIYVSN